MTGYADVRFYAGLRDFLATDRRSGTVTRTFDVPGSVKDMIEACGVPHTEVEVVLANGDAVDFGYRVRDGDRISVYPPFYDFEVEPTWRVGPAPANETRFVLDVHLGKLAGYLRLLGFDTRYDTDTADPELVKASVAEDRVLLTRDVKLLMHGVLERGYFVRAVTPRAQLIEVSGRFALASTMRPFTRCMECNSRLRDVAKEDVVDRLEPKTRKYYDVFRVCTGCDRIYWKGSHHERLQNIVDEIAE